jgi:CheY-like chemotaxis protein
MPGKILIIDDDPDFKEAMSTLLEARGYDIITAHDGGSGYEKAKSEQPDLILLDVMMAHKTEGFDVARCMKDDESVRDIPVIMTTGIRKDMNLPFGFEADDEWLPVKAVIEKPVKPDVLLAEVAKYIGK